MATIIFETKTPEEREAKRKERQKWAQHKLNATKQWVSENPELTVGIITTVSGLVMGTIKTISRIHRLDNERELKDNYIYDNRLGKYWHLRRPLRNSEALELERRRDLGENMGQILDSMRVLK